MPGHTNKVVICSFGYSQLCTYCRLVRCAGASHEHVYTQDLLPWLPVYNAQSLKAISSSDLPCHSRIQHVCGIWTFFMFQGAWAKRETQLWNLPSQSVSLWMDTTGTGLEPQDLTVFKARSAFPRAAS